MEENKIMYIFGSFSRKKDKRKSLETPFLSAGNSPVHGKASSRPFSQPLVVAPRTTPYNVSKKVTVKEWECGICKEELVEPRLLECLHNFCTRCLLTLQESWSDVVESAPSESAGSRSESGAGSAGSGYESDLRRSGSDGSWEHTKPKCGIYSRKVIDKTVQFLVCPTCACETELPAEGVAGLPINYVLLRKILLGQDNKGENILCDLCITDQKAKGRCNQCLVSICSVCVETHGRQEETAGHLIHTLDPDLVKICTQHPKGDLKIYCSTCQKVICRDCCLVSHYGHVLGNASRAATERARILRDACERAKMVPENVERATKNITTQAYDNDCQAALVEKSVVEWGEQYRRAVAAHTRALGAAAARAREVHRALLDLNTRALAERARHALHAVRAAEELLSEGKEDEILALSGPVLKRLEKVTELEPFSEVPPLELRFAPEAPSIDNPTLFGRLFAQATDPEMCVLNTEGLLDLRVDVEQKVTLELRDTNGDKIWCAGDQVVGYYRRRDSSARPTLARVVPQTDGTYTLIITPRSPGAYLLAVTVNNTPIKGSPFACCARAGAPHWGTYHCCTFCSTGGKKDATCGCGSQMSRGYKALLGSPYTDCLKQPRSAASSCYCKVNYRLLRCGHGHAGWPGTRHWSCCGATRRDASCSNPRRVSTALYHVSL